MKFKTQNMDLPTWLIFLCIILGAIFSVLGGIGLSQKQSSTAKQNQEAIIDSLESKNEKLATNLDSTKLELLAKQAELKAEQSKIHEFAKEINSNTRTISGLTKEISKVTTRTNDVANIIENEQRQKGKIILKRPKGDIFLTNVGNNFQQINSAEFEKGVHLDHYFEEINLNIYIKFIDQEILVSVVLTDVNGNHIIEMVDGEWAVNKSNYFSINYDHSAIEIIDNSGIVVFQMESSENDLRFYGVDYHFLETKVMGGLGIRTFSNNLENFKIKYQYVAATTIRRIFRHVGTDYLRERSVENKNKKYTEEKIKALVKKELLLDYGEISNSELIQRSKKTLIDLRSFRKQGFERIEFLSDEDRLLEAMTVEEVILKNYHDFVRTDAIKLRNTLIKKVNTNGRPVEYNISYENPRYFYYDLGVILIDLEAMLKLLNK